MQLQVRHAIVFRITSDACDIEGPCRTPSAAVSNLPGCKGSKACEVGRQGKLTGI